MFQIGILVVGGLWGLLIARKEEAALVLYDHPEIFMSVSATVLLIFSFACHLVYLDTVTDVYSSAGMIAGQKARDAHLTIADVFAPGIDYLFSALRAFLYAGIVNAIPAFVSAHKLKS